MVPRVTTNKSEYTQNLIVTDYNRTNAVRRCPTLFILCPIFEKRNKKRENGESKRQRAENKNKRASVLKTNELRLFQTNNTEEPAREQNTVGMTGSKDIKREKQLEGTIVHTRPRADSEKPNQKTLKNGLSEAQWVSWATHPQNWAHTQTSHGSHCHVVTAGRDLLTVVERSPLYSSSQSRSNSPSLRGVL